ncbi:MAG: hypothetical protein LC749_19585, partial [Actinobacteria bacterium]|nr:hypothetical protein [Actinomycetota bacterium]
HGDAGVSRPPPPTPTAAGYSPDDGQANRWTQPPSANDSATPTSPYSTAAPPRSANSLLQAPTPVVAGMLGYHSAHAELLATQAGGTWKKYAPGDHTL